jgi:hypothetical protein
MRLRSTCTILGTALGGVCGASVAADHHSATVKRKDALLSNEANPLATKWIVGGAVAGAAAGAAMGFFGPDIALFAAAIFLRD